MRRLLLAFLLTSAAAALSPVAAQEAMDSSSRRVRILGGFGQAKAVAVGDRVFRLDDVYFYADLTAKIGNLVLVSMSTSGSACPAMYAWLDTTPGKVRLSKEFGTCSDLPEVSHDAEVVTVTLPSLDPSRGPVAFDFDGRTITERPLGLQPSGLAGSAPDAWIGKPAVQWLSAPEHEAALIALMGWEALDAARAATVIASPDQGFTRAGEWLVASGCQPHACNMSYAAVAIHRETGAPVVALKLDGAPARLLGTPPAALPTALREIMTGG